MRIKDDTYQFRNIEDMSAEQHCHPHPGSPLLMLLWCEIRRRGIGQECQAKFIVVFVILFPSVVGGEHLS